MTFNPISLKRSISTLILVILPFFLTGCSQVASEGAVQSQGSSVVTPVVSPSPTVTVKTEVKEEIVEFGTQTVDDASIYSGETKVKTEGVNGKKVSTYEVTYTGLSETGRKLVDEQTIKPVTKVVSRGTKVKASPAAAVKAQGNALGDTYTNVDGNEVQKPLYSDTVPAGASARCGDGTYSFSQNRRGTCSGHGGVDEWL